MLEIATQVLEDLVDVARAAADNCGSCKARDRFQRLAVGVFTIGDREDRDVGLLIGYFCKSSKVLVSAVSWPSLSNTIALMRSPLSPSSSELGMCGQKGIIHRGLASNADISDGALEL